MAARRTWGSYQRTYRAREMRTLAGWILAGHSGSVVGLAGAGKSNLLGFLCHRPDAIRSYLPLEAGAVALVPVDLNNLPANTLATFYRVLLRSFYEIRDRWDPALQETIAAQYRQHQATRDPFLAQSALREVLFGFQAQNVRVVMVLDRFDGFCETATPQMLDTLRGLRDSFKDTLSYIVGARREVAYLFDPEALGEMYELLDTHVCWVGPMAESDARQLIAEETCLASPPPDETAVAHLLHLAGGYPALLKAACPWWQSAADRLPPSGWESALFAERGIQNRLKEIWDGLTQEEQLAISELRASQTQGSQPPRALEGHAGKAGLPPHRQVDQPHQTLHQLQAKGLCRHTDAGWRVFSSLFAAYVSGQHGRGGGRIWLDDETAGLHQGQTHLLDLSPLETNVLTYMVENPRARHTKTDLIVGAWPDELRQQGVTDDSLYQVIRELRKKLEPDPAQPCYITTWRGRPEGGYQFFPEGRPA